MSTGAEWTARRIEQLRSEHARLGARIVELETAVPPDAASIGRLKMQQQRIVHEIEGHGGAL